MARRPRPSCLQHLITRAVLPLQRKEIDILKRVSFNRNVVQFYGFCLDESAPMLVRPLSIRGSRAALLQCRMTILHAQP